jgi:hypothetical protein
VLIGLRQWDADKEFASKSSNSEKKIQKCDLLEIYSASEREKLRVQEKIFQDLVMEGNNSDGDGDGDRNGDRDDEFKTNYTVEFKDTKTLEYQEIIAQGGKLSKLSTATSYQTIYDQISDSDSDDDHDHAYTHHDTHAHHAHDHHAHHDTPTVKPSASTAKYTLEEVDIDDI